jgi:hypothetical protein
MMRMIWLDDTGRRRGHLRWLLPLLLLRRPVDIILWYLLDPFFCTGGCWKQAYLIYDVSDVVVTGLLRPSSLGPSLTHSHRSRGFTTGTAIRCWGCDSLTKPARKHSTGRHHTRERPSTPHNFISRKKIWLHIKSLNAMSNGRRHLASFWLFSSLHSVPCHLAVDFITWLWNRANLPRFEMFFKRR